MKQLSIKDVAFEAVWRYWGLRRELLSVMIVPIAGFLAIDLGASMLDMRSSAAARYAHWAVYVVVSTLAAISCHRVLLLGPVSVPKFGVGHLGTRELRFIAATLFLGFVFTVARLLSDLLMREITGPIGDLQYRYLVETLVALPGSYLFARLVFMLPSIAVETRTGIPGAWQLSGGNGWRLVLIVIFLPWVVRLLQWNIASVISDGTVRTIANTLLYGLFLPLEIALLSVSYRHLIK